MSLGLSTYGIVQTPRVYIDNFLLARTLGVNFEIGNLRGVYEDVDMEDYIYLDGDIEKRKLLWDLDPVRYTKIMDPPGDDPISKVKMEIRIPSEFQPLYSEFLKIMGTSNYAAILNHNLYSGAETLVQAGLEYNGTTTIGASDTTSIVGDFNEDIENDGFIIAKIDISPEEDKLFEFDFVIKSQGATMPPGFNYNIGCFSLGTYLDFPRTPDLNVKINYSHEGVSRKRTISGKDITHITYPGAPDWGQLLPFTSSKDSGSYYKSSGLTGRKSWDMSFRYLDKSEVFRSIESGNSAGFDYRLLESGGDYIGGNFREDQSILGTYLSRTLGGQLKHMLQPDNTKAEFYIVTLDQDSTTITQSSHGVFDINFKFVQAW